MSTDTDTRPEAKGRGSPRRLLFLIPVAIFGVLVGYFIWGLDPERDIRAIPSVLIDQPAPEFDLPPITGMDGPGLRRADLATGEVSVVNVFASWCVPCRAEHPLLTELAERDGVRLLGINYKDKPKDARAWLAKLGNPYALIGADEDGRAAIEWGVYGVPETFIVDGAGRIRHKHLGPIDRQALDEVIRPLIKELAK
jgi:cytochrome c biogenesis protein CcmG/thiol:disulfide interchange protein DsbE